MSTGCTGPSHLGGREGKASDILSSVNLPASYNIETIIGPMVIPPFLTGFEHRIQAANFSFWAGVIPPMAILGRSLL